MLDLIKNEEEILSYWKEKGIMAKMREKNRGKKLFYFLDGPPFVSGDLHPGQMWVKSMKDVILRYKRLRGFDVYDRAGYDVQGLPIEKKVEANLKIGSKREIETKIGIEKFIESCKEFVTAYIGKMDSDYARFGISLDFSNPYLPYKNEYIEMEWWFFNEIWKKGLVYNDKRATLYCPNCGTAVSQGGMETNYLEDEDPSIYVAFKINTKLSKPRIEVDENTFLLIWTTTPWTLPANMAVAVNPKELYVKARFGNRNFIIAKSRFDQVVHEIGESAVVESEFYGSELEGIYYMNPLEEKVEIQKKFRKQHRILLSEEMVASGEGSGLVHIAPGHGFEDYLLGKKNKITIFSPVNEQALYTQEAGAYAGLRVPGEANEKVIQDLRDLGVLIKRDKIRHSYPHCWRCDEKLIFIATNQWFINIQKVKKKLLRENSKVSWHPEEARGWQDNVLASSPDWCISRQRYWGAPMPIWEDDSGHKKVIASFAELSSIALDKEAVGRIKDYHRPYIDSVRIKCEECGKEMKRIPDILDVWFDSGIAFRASLTKEQFELLFPGDFILEAVEQLRAWFSCLLKISVMVYGKRPFKNIVTHGMLLGADGREMHKKEGNYVPLNELLKRDTADAFRLWCTEHTPQYDLLFSEERIKESEKTVIMLHNVSNLIREYSAAIGYVPKKIRIPRGLDSMKHEDAWLVSRFNTVVKEATERLDNYEIDEYVNLVRDFLINEFSRIYLKIAKKKILYGGKKEAKQTVDLINYVFHNLLILISPVAPFSAEKQYIDTYKYSESVSLLDWPKYRTGLIDKKLEEDFGAAIDAITALLNAREKVNIKLRWPIANATLEVRGDKSQLMFEKLADVIEDYTNIKKVHVKRVEAFGKEIRPIFSKLGPLFKENAPLIAEAIKKENPEKVEKEMETSGQYALHTEKGVFNLMPDHLSISEKLENPDAVIFKHGIAYVDKEMSKELWEEAMVREFERSVQVIRKEMTLRKTDRIEVFYQTNKSFAEIIKRNDTGIRKNVNAKRLNEGIAEERGSKEFEVEEEKFRVAIQKITQ